MQELGFGFIRAMVAEVVTDYLVSTSRPNPFRGGVPGKDWWTLFLRRWPQLCVRKPEHLSKKRAEGVTQKVVDHWIELVQKVFKKNGLDELLEDEIANRLWNADETGLCLDATSTKVLARRGAKSVYEIGGGSGREFITVLGCGSADGIKLPPFVVYKAKNLWERWTRGGIAAARYGVSDSGWMEADNFKDWFKCLFVPSVSHLLVSGPVVLFVDGHGSHISHSLVTTARKEGVIIMCLPPHSSHLLQPLDVACYGPLKTVWKETLKHYKLQTAATQVTKAEFPGLLKMTWEKSLLEKHLQSGFKHCGLHPLSNTAVPNTKLSGPQCTAQVSTPKRHSIEVISHCSCIRPHLTPLRLHLRDHFAKLLVAKTQPSRAGSTSAKESKKKIRPDYYGQSLTSDEVAMMIEQKEKETKSKKKSMSACVSHTHIVSYV